METGNGRSPTPAGVSLLSRRREVYLYLHRSFGCVAPCASWTLAAARLLLEYPIAVCGPLAALCPPCGAVFLCFCHSAVLCLTLLTLGMQHRNGPDTTSRLLLLQLLLLVIVTAAMQVSAGDSVSLRVQSGEALLRVTLDRPRAATQDDEDSDGWASISQGRSGEATTTASTS